MLMTGMRGTHGSCGCRAVTSDRIDLQDFGLFVKSASNPYLLPAKLLRRLLIAQYGDGFAVVQRVLAALIDASVIRDLADARNWPRLWGRTRTAAGRYHRR